MAQLTNLIIGGFLIALGFLSKAYPILIAGYNTMPEDKKRNVDIEGLSTMIRNHFIAIGCLLIVGSYGFSFLGWKTLASTWPIISVVGVLPFTLVLAQKYDHNQRSPTRLLITIPILLIIFMSTFVFLYVGSKAPEIDVSGKTLTISGIYGMTAEIQMAEQVDQLNLEGRRTNGFQLGSVYKGHFDLKSAGKCILFLQSADGPFIKIETADHQTIYINAKDPVATEGIFEKISMR